jgi:hypothetical protein
LIGLTNTQEELNNINARRHKASDLQNSTLKQHKIKRSK